MRVLLWATTLQADILALALHLDRRPDVDLMVVAPGVEAFLGEPVAAARPLLSPLVDRRARGVRAAVRAFEPDVVVCDNHMPPFPAAPRLCAMWHGLGWKARGRRDIRAFHREVRRLTGRGADEPNRRFLAQCYGEPDRRWRVEKWGVHDSRCRVIGMAYTDLLLAPPYTREELAPRYEIDVCARKTVLLSFTWHYGRAFADWGEDLPLLRGLVGAIGDAGANVLMCMHDRHRYEARYLEGVEALAAGDPRVQLKYKSDHPDNLADLVVADVMVSNLSSFITYFYVTGRPSVHLRTIDPERADVRLATVRRGRLRDRKLAADEPLWMTDPGDNGGLLARDPGQMLSALGRALEEPDSCRGASAAYLSRHVDGVDGRTCARFADELARFCEETI